MESALAIQVNEGHDENLDTNDPLLVHRSHQLNTLEPPPRPSAPPNGLAAPFITAAEVKLNYYQPLHLAAKEGDWVAAKSFIDSDDRALRAVISLQGMTALHVAASSYQSEFVEELVKLTPASALGARDKRGCTALHYVAIGGTKKAAEALVNKNPDLPLRTDIDGKTPLFFAANWGVPSKSKEMLRYLSGVTEDEHPSYAFTGPCSTSLILGIAAAGFYDITMDLLERYPHLATARDETETTILHVISGHPQSFPSGNSLGFWEIFIYSPVDWLYKAVPVKKPRLKHVYSRKPAHEHSFKLIEFVCNRAVLLNNAETLSFFLDGGVLHVATARGAVEIVEVILKYVPDLLWYKFNNLSLLQVAIKHRRAKLFNLLIHLMAQNTFEASGLDNDSNNTLHMAAKLAPSPQLNAVSGSAFQMQRELQWFKEVEKMVNNNYKWQTNSQGKTPREVFTETHKDLLEKSEQWMKDTANSCMVVSTLIATVVFAAVFTVPGGNTTDHGVPFFLKEKYFVVFAVSDAVALFYSISSLLIFLSILTARYAEEDFLEPLPRKLALGFASLYVAIASMMIAFGAAFSVVVGERYHWVFTPMMVSACIPVSLFTILKVPLFWNIARTTYGPGMFTSKLNRG